MGKNLQQQSTGLSIERNHPGCMWGILHALHHYRWHQVRKKMLPHKRHGGGRRAMGDGNQGNGINAANAGEKQEQIDTKTSISLIGEKAKESGSVSKSSMKSRIRALIAEEISKRRGRHCRSSSYPTQMQLKRTNSIHHLEASGLNSLSKAASNDDIPRMDHEEIEINSAASTMDPPKANEQEPVTSEEKCQLCDKLNKAKQDLGSDKSVSLDDSKQVLDVLDMLNMNKELFLKVLQDPNPPSANYFRGCREFDSETRFTKSTSFPLSEKRSSGPRKLKHKPESESCADGEEKTQVGSEIETMEKPFGNSSFGSPPRMKNGMENKVATKSFKNLKQKIRQAIRESRKEKHRITMDAVLHKIPYGRKFSKDLSGEISCLWKEAEMDNCSKSSHQYMRRMFSFDESLDRYQWLYESTFNTEAKHHKSKRLKLRTEESPSPSRSAPKTLGRILSLPDLRSYYYQQSEDFPDATTSRTPMRTDMNSIESQKTSVETSELNFVAEDEAEVNEEAEREVGFSPDDLGSLETSESYYQQENEIQATVSPVCEMAEPSPISVPESSQEDMASPRKFSLSEDPTLQSMSLFSDELKKTLDSLPDQNHEVRKDSPNVEEKETSIEQWNERDLVSTKDVPEFNYVKYILDLSGFSRDELLGTWHSPDQPVDPSVFEELEGCLLPNIHYSGNEEAAYSDHLLLFDVTNEVLLEIYERSFTYWPKPLSPTSHILRIPVGYRVVEEVWANISWYLSLRPESDQSLDSAVTWDLSKGDGWMNLQFEAECVGLELEGMIFDDLLDELV